MCHLARQETNSTHKSNCQRTGQMLLKWRHDERDVAEWTPEVSFSAESSHPRDHLSREERQAIQEAALEYEPVLAYDNVTRAESDRWGEWLSRATSKTSGDAEKSLPSSR